MCKLFLTFTNHAIITSIVLPEIALCLLTIPFDHPDSAAVGFNTMLNCSVISKNKLLLNSHPLSEIITPDAPNISTISSFRFEFTTGATPKLVLLSVICKNANLFSNLLKLHH